MQVNNGTLLVAIVVVSGLLVPINDYLETMYVCLCLPAAGVLNGSEEAGNG